MIETRMGIKNIHTIYLMNQPVLIGLTGLAVCVSIAMNSVSVRTERTGMIGWV